MDEDVKICRLCLKIGEKDVPYFPISSYNAVLRNLNLLSFVTIKKAELTEDPLICNLCDNKLTQLESFKENVISNEFQIQCNEKNDGNSFLEAVSEDIDKICRLCLKTPDDAIQLQKNWKDSEQSFTQCNIHLNLNILKPSKMCNACDTMVKTIVHFVKDCSETEKHIADQASKTENLSLKEILVEISTVKSKTLATKSCGEDNNNVSQEQEADETSSTKVVGQLKVSPSSNEAKNTNKVTDNVVTSISISERKGGSDASENNDTKERLSPENTENELNNVSQDQKSNGKVASNSTKLSSENIVFTEPPCDLSPLSNKTPKTYERIDQHQKNDDKIANIPTESSSENILCTEPPCDVSPLLNEAPKIYARSDQDQKTDDKVENTPTESSSENILCTEPPVSNKTPKTYARSDQDQKTDDKVASISTDSSSENILCTEPPCDVSPVSNKTPKTYARSDQDQKTDDNVASISTESSSENILCTEPPCDVSPVSNKTPKTYARSDQDQKTDDNIANISTESSSENILCTEPPCDVSPVSNKTPKTYARSDQDQKTDDNIANISTESSSENILCTEPPCDVSPVSNKMPKTYGRSDQDQKTDDKIANISTESSSENILSTEPSCDVSPVSNKTPKMYARSDQDQKNDDKIANISTESSYETILHIEPPCDASPLSNKTPKTYARTRSKVPRNIQVIAPTLKLNILSDVRMRDQNEPSTSKLKENESIIDQIISDFSDGSEYTSIDASPIRNVADITLDMTLGPGGVIQTENGEFQKDNITQELIYLLEGTEDDVEIKNVSENGIGSSKQYKNTEELLRVLEDDDEDVYDQIKAISEEDGKKQEEVKSSHTKKNQMVAINRPVLQTASTAEAAPVQRGEKKVQILKNLKGKSINTVFKQSTPVKKGKITSNTNNKSGGTQVAQRKHNLRQKTIIMSFREMLNMKPLKNKTPQVPENLIKEMPETNNTTEMVQAQNIILEGKKRTEEPENKPETFGKKRPVKKTAKNAIDDQEKETVHKAGTSYKVQSAKKLVKTISDTLDISQIENISFDKIHIKEISLVDDNPSSSTETQAKSTAKKAPVKRMHKNKIESGNNTDVFITNNTLQTSIQAPDTAAENISVVDKKRGKRKTALENQKEVVPIKRLKKSTQKQVSEDSKELDTNEKDQGSLSARKGRARACKETTKSKQVDADNETVSGGDEAENSEESDDESHQSEAASQPSNKPVVVIIRRKKTKNKAQRDKTWSQLTGKPVEKDGNNEEIVDDEEVPKKKRGRPPLPDSDRKPKKPKPKYYKCSCCAFKTISQNIITQHRYIHNVVDTAVLYKCHQCGFKTPSEKILEEHKVSHLMSETIYKCMFCEFNHKKKNSTMYHTLRHEDKDIANMFYCLVWHQDTDEEQYECFQCEYQSTEEAVMPDHVIDHQVEKIKNSIMTKFSCKQCLYKTKFEDMFKRHQEMHKEEKKGVKVAKKDIKKEPEVVEAQPEESQGQGQEEVAEALTVYSCDLCCYHTYNKRSLANHKGLKHTRYAPPDANLEARRSKKRVPLPDEIYRCNECEYTTQKKPHLTRHMIIHRSKENMEYYECTYCIFETKHRRSYKRHMEVKHKVIV